VIELLFERETRHVDPVESVTRLSTQILRTSVEVHQQHLIINAMIKDGWTLSYCQLQEPPKEQPKPTFKKVDTFCPQCGYESQCTTCPKCICPTETKQ
jgi:hypothetical protein